MKMQFIRLTFSTAILMLSFQLNAQLNIDKFTGDLTYNLPLLQVAATNGPSIPVSAMYQSGVGVEQEASEIGLGWDLGAAGSIRRMVSGIPDDCNGCSQINNSAFTGITSDFETTYGVLYYKNDDDLKGDVYRHVYKMDSLGYPVFLPDYDEYFISGPGIGGELKPRMYEYYDLGLADGADPENKTQFYFANDFSDTLDNRYFTWENSIMTRTGTTAVTIEYPGWDVGTTGSNISYEGAFNNKNHYVEYNKNRVRTANFVEYFTNQEIKDHKATTQLIKGGFIEYSSGITRSTTSTDADLIGAFRVTNESGFTYHYSLPVYEISQTNAGYDLNYDWTNKDFNTHKDSVTIPGIVKDDKGTTATEDDVVWKYKVSFKHAVEWKLTGITGPDFVDDGDGILDDGDEGYWVLFDYTKDSSDPVIRSPYKGFEFSFTAWGVDFEDFDDQDGIQNPEMKVDRPEKITGNTGSFGIVEKEHYYINEIKTALQVAEFTYASRLDAQTDRLTEIEVKEREGNNTLKKVKFVQDYSLAPGFYRNSNVTFSSAVGDYDSPNDVQTDASYTRNTLSGKLTLNEIEYYGTEGEKTHPDYLFYYDVSSTTDNPDYNPLKQDYWGYYKDNGDTKGLKGYTTSSSSPDAWSLRSVVTPDGDSLSFIYESDTYTSVLTDSYYGSRKYPQRIFAIQDIDSITGAVGIDWEVQLESGQQDFEDLVTAIGSNTGTIKAYISSLIPFVYWDSTCYCLDNLQVPFWAAEASYYNRVTDFSKVDLTGTYSTLEDMTRDPSITTPIDMQALLNESCTPGTGGCITDLSYVGGGFVAINYDEGREAYGGGIRVAQVKTSDGNGDTYVVKYTYNDGVATTEQDPFFTPSMFKSMDDYKHTLESKQTHKLTLRPQVGYTSVKEENMGLNNTALGFKLYHFNVENANGNADMSYHQLGGKFYYQPFVYNTSWWERAEEPQTFVETPVETYVEVIDEFSSFWGSIAKEEVFDDNNVLIQRSDFEYEHPVAGAETEAFLYSFEKNTGGGSYQYIPSPTEWNPDPQYYIGWPNLYYDPPSPLHTGYLGVVREFPTRLKKVRTFSNGVHAVVVNEEFDPVTGAVTSKRSLNSHDTQIQSLTEFAYNQPPYAKMGPKSDNFNFDNLLLAEYSGKTHKDLALSGDSAILNNTKVLWTTKAKIREFDGTAKEYKSNTDYVNWYTNRSYAWRGPLNEFGTYEEDDFVDFQPGMVLNLAWTEFSSKPLYKYTGSKWAGTTMAGGTALTTELVVLYDKSKYDQIYETEDLQSNTVLYDIDDFLQEYPNAHTTSAWVKDNFGELYASSGNVFIATNGAIHDNWRKQGEITLLNQHNSTLETEDMNGRYHASKFMFDDLVEYAVASNSNYTSFTATSFEELITHGDSNYVEGEVNIYSCSRASSLTAHSGKYYLEMDASEMAKHRITDYGEFQSGRTYRASVWMHSTSNDNAYLKVNTVNTSGNPVSETISKNDANAVAVGDWVLLNLDVFIPDTVNIDDVEVGVYTTGSGGAKIDDLRFHYINAPLTVKVFDRDSGRLLTEIDGNNYSTSYTYNDQDKVSEVHIDIPEVGRKKVKEREYHYSRKY